MKARRLREIEEENRAALTIQLAWRRKKGQMALHDPEVHRFIAFGIAGIAIAADSLSAIKYAKVKPIRDENGLAVDFEVEGEFPRYGNDDDRADDLAISISKYFIESLRKTKV